LAGRTSSVPGLGAAKPSAHEQTASYLNSGPAPVSSGRPPGALAAELDTLEGLLDAAKGRLGMLTAGHLSRCRLLERADDHLRLGVPGEAILAHLQSPDESREITDAFSQVLGRRVTVEFVVLEEAVESGPEEARPLDAEVKEVADLFGGRVVRRRKPRNE